ncbi:hypothetical protein X801_04081, partial [Opisthorchis viverrini]
PFECTNWISAKQGNRETNLIFDGLFLGDELHTIPAGMEDIFCPTSLLNYLKLEKNSHHVIVSTRLHCDKPTLTFALFDQPHILPQASLGCKTYAIVSFFLVMLTDHITSLVCGSHSTQLTL